MDNQVRTDQELILEEAQKLLKDFRWNSRQSRVLQGLRLGLIIELSYEDAPQRVNAQFSLLPLGLSKASLNTLEGYILELHGKVNRLGRFNAQAQIFFKDIEEDNYILKLTPPRGKESLQVEQKLPGSIFTGLTFSSNQVLPQAVAAAGTGRSLTDIELGVVKTNAAGWLKAIFYEDARTGYLRVFFSASTREYDRAVIPFVWRGNGESAPSLNLLTVLTWDEHLKTCRAEMNLGVAPQVFEVGLPEMALEMARLDWVGEETIRNSFRLSDKWTRETWRTLLDSPDLPKNCSEILEKAFKLNY